MGMAELRKPAACPKCGGTTIRRICYGIPNEEAWALVRSGQGTLGGCFVTEWMSDWDCEACNHRWFDPDDPVKQEMEQLHASIVARHRRRRSGSAEPGAAADGGGR
jgi:ribosomal protein L37AE/L43A